MPNRGVATVHIEASSGEITRIERAGRAGTADLPLGEADAWELVLSIGGRPCGRLLLPDPGEDGGHRVLGAAALAASHTERAREILAGSLRERMGGPPREFPPLSVSVVVCTSERPHLLGGLLEATSRLDPAPLEVIVVDNAPPGGEDCRELAGASGAVYVRENARGLNNARRAGIAAAKGELTAFTDDDCLPPPQWLAVLPELFDDRNVAAATGPGFPAALDTPAQVRFERAASFSRGFQRREWDFRLLSPGLAGLAGAGANLVVRRDALGAMDELFPPELDAGTPTRSGGDTYALFKLLAVGRRVVYEPRLYTYHRHREDPRALHEAIRGYGVGLGAVAAKLLIAEREPASLLAYRWLLRQYAGTLARGLVGARDRVEMRLAWDYVRGGIAGPAAWRRSLRIHRDPRRASPALPRVQAEPASAQSPAVERASAEPAEVSVVVITNRPGGVPGRCLAALAAQTDAPSFEVVLVDDSPPGDSGATPQPPGLRIRLVRTGGRGAARARNAGAEAARGDLLLFLDDDLVPAPDLIAAHARRQRSGGEAVVVGYSPPRPVRPGLAALSASIWWEDYFRAKREAIAPTFTEMLSGNVSLRRETFERVGPFDTEFGLLRREDWEWGIRALQAGVGIAYEPRAVAQHRFALDTLGRLRAARAEGAGDALLVARHPFARASLPASRTTGVGGALSRAAFRLALHRGFRERAFAALLDRLEHLRMRRAWAHWAQVAQLAAYEEGFRSGRISGASADREHAIDVDLLSEEPIPPPRVAAPRIDLTSRGRPMGRVPAVDGQWTVSLAQRMARRVPAAELERAPPSVDAAPPHDGDAGAVAVLPSPAGSDSAEQWREIDRALRTSRREIVALPLPGVEVEHGWTEPVAAVLRGGRVAVLTGASLDGGPLAGPIFHSRVTLETPHPPIGPPSQYVAVSRDAYQALGGLDPGAARIGYQGGVLDLLERALRGGWVVGYCDLPGIGPAADARRWRRSAEWERWRAHGALVRRDAHVHGIGWWVKTGLVPPLSSVLRSARRRGRGMRGALGTTAAFAVGSVAGGAPERSSP